MSFGQVSDFMDMMSSIYDDNDKHCETQSKNKIHDDCNNIDKNNDYTLITNDSSNNTASEILLVDSTQNIEIVDNVLSEEPTIDKEGNKIRFTSLKQFVSNMFIESSLNICVEAFENARNFFLSKTNAIESICKLFRISDWMVDVFQTCKKFVDTKEQFLVMDGKNRYFCSDYDLDEYRLHKSIILKSKLDLMLEIFSDTETHSTNDSHDLKEQMFMIIIIVISELSHTDSVLSFQLQKMTTNEKKFGTFDLSKFNTYYFWEIFSYCCRSEIVKDGKFYNLLYNIITDVSTQNHFFTNHLMRSCMIAKNNDNGTSKFKTTFSENMNSFISSKNYLLNSYNKSDSKIKKIKPEHLEIRSSSGDIQNNEKISFSDQLKKVNWLFESFKSLATCLENNSNYLNNGRISKINGNYDENNKTYTKKIIIRKKPFTKGSRFDAYQNFLVHKWIHKKLLSGLSVSIKTHVQSISSTQFMEIIKSKFAYKLWNSNEYLESYKIFRSLIASIWFKIPLCFRRGIMLSEKNKKRLKHFDRFKMATFLYMSIFRQISQLSTSTPENTLENISRNIQITSIFSVRQMTQFIFTFLEEISSGKTLVGETSISDFFGKKININDSNSINVDQSSISESEYGEKQFKSIKTHIEDLVSREKSEKSFIQSNCSSMADLRHDGISSSFALESTIIICPFSEKNKSKMLNSKDEEYKIFTSSPKCITNDIEDLGSNFKNEIHREYYSDKIDSMFGSIDVQKLKKEFNEKIFSSTSMEEVYYSCYSLCQNCNQNSKKEGVLFFSNPNDKLLKIIYRGDTKDI